MAKSILSNHSKKDCQPRGYLHPSGGTAAKVAASHKFPLRLCMHRLLTMNTGVMSLKLIFLLQILQGLIRPTMLTNLEVQEVYTWFYNS